MTILSDFGMSPSSPIFSHLPHPRGPSSSGSESEGAGVGSTLGRLLFGSIKLAAVLTVLTRSVGFLPFLAWLSCALTLS